MNMGGLINKSNIMTPVERATKKEDTKLILEEIKKLREDMRGIELMLENIRLIAEGQLNLFRKLDEVLKVENEKELLLARVNALEDEVRKLKE